jgi:hypothetical protein
LVSEPDCAVTVTAKFCADGLGTGDLLVVGPPPHPESSPRLMTANPIVEALKTLGFIRRWENKAAIAIRTQTGNQISLTVERGHKGP